MLTGPSTGRRLNRGWLKPDGRSPRATASNLLQSAWRTTIASYVKRGQTSTMRCTGRRCSKAGSRDRGLNAIARGGARGASRGMDMILGRGLRCPSAGGSAFFLDSDADNDERFRAGRQ